MPANACGDAQTKAANVKADLMTRLGNAIKQRDAAREEALLAGEKLNKMQARLLCCFYCGKHRANAV